MSVFDNTFDSTFAYQTPVTVIVRGSGIINGVGTYHAGREVEIEAIPSSFMRFRHWQYEDEIIEENPYVFIALEKEMNFIAIFYMTIEDWLRGMIGYPVTDASIFAAETNRGIVFGSDALVVTEEQRELALADLITIICQMPSTTGTEDAMGDWKHKTSGSSVGSIAVLMKRANAIYAKYNANPNGLFIKDKTQLW